MKSQPIKAAVLLLVAGAAFGLLAACGSSSQGVIGNWTAPDGSSSYITQDGQCAGMYWQNSQPLDIGGPEVCSYSGSALIVTQSPNKITYSAKLSGDTMTLTQGNQTLVFKRQ